MSLYTPVRIRPVNDTEISADGDYVLYWMISFRRGHLQLQSAASRRVGEEAQQAAGDSRSLALRLPVGQRPAAQICHRGDGGQCRALRQQERAVLSRISSRQRGAGKGLLKELAEPRLRRGERRFSVLLSASHDRRGDEPRSRCGSNWSIPTVCCRCELRTRSSRGRSTFGDSCRRTCCRIWPMFRQRDPLSRVKLPDVAAPAREDHAALADGGAGKVARVESGLALLPDRSLRWSRAETVGGSRAAGAVLRSFLKSKLPIYESDRNQPEKEATSGLSPYLHFGHVSVHEVFEELTRLVEWTPDQVAEKATGSNSGWWGASPEVESFLDELITWRELGYNMCWQRDDYDQYESLPDWAQQTLAEHAGDHRPHRLFAGTIRGGHRRMTNCGTRLNGNWSAKAAFTITCGCCGARRFLSGPRRRANRSTS